MMENKDLSNLFIGVDGRLYKKMTLFRKGEAVEILGVKITELWCDAYELNLRKGGELLFPAESCSPNPFPVVDHVLQRDDFVNKGGGFRIDFNWDERYIKLI